MAEGVSYPTEQHIDSSANDSVVYPEEEHGAENEATEEPAPEA